MYKKASQLKLRFETPVGSLTVEQLWSLSQKHLETSLTTAYQYIKKEVSEELSFLTTQQNNEVDEITTLRFNILKDVFLTKRQEISDAAKSKEIKDYNNKINQLILAKEEDDLKTLSVEELQKLLKK